MDLEDLPRRAFTLKITFDSDYAINLTFSKLRPNM
jgi:hypothetical protein